MQRLVLVSLRRRRRARHGTDRPARPGLASCAGAGVAAAGPIKIAFISSQEILQKTPGYAAAESTYRKELQASQTEYQKLQQQLDSAVQVFDQQSLVLSPAAGREAEGSAGDAAAGRAALHRAAGPAAQRDRNCWDRSARASTP